MASLTELQQLAGTDWVRLYDGLVSQSHIVEAVTWMAAPRRALNMKPLSWPEIARDTVGFYRSLKCRSGESTTAASALR